MANRMKPPSSKSPAHSSSSARQAPALTRQRPIKASGLVVSKKKPLKEKNGVSKPSASGSRSSKQAASKSVFASSGSDSTDRLAKKVQDTKDLPALEHNRIIKKYPNRRLYDTLFSSYVTLSDVKDLVMSQELFHVLDAKTGEDITRSILMQVILEEEAHGQPLNHYFQRKACCK
ncbi:MAG: hypothetical protein RIR83_1694 [Pseudomonadota bacterium]